jgi:protein involved in polysaccharide export with SLBB domain
MKKLILFSILLPVFFIHSQELDQAFLDSLPDDVRDDLQERSDNQDDLSSENYRASKYSSKLMQAQELVDLKNRMEADLIELQRRLEGDAVLKIDTELKLFGSDFFSTFQTSFMPINEPNPGSSYSLDIGDTLNIQLIGQKDFIEDFLINGDGSISIQGIGKIVLAGLTLDKAVELIKARVNSAYIGTETFISLSRIRDVNILISGDAENPGIYTLAGNSNILQAVNIAGGVNEYGSYRKINLIRDNKIIEVLDMYDLLINGNFNLKERLRSGDVIFIEPRGNIIAIDGAVKRPAKYELIEKQNLGEVYKYSSGFKQTADIQNIYLERILDGSLKSIPIVNISQLDSVEPVDGDMIYVREFPYRQANISGAVLKPGLYTLAAGENLDDLINKAGGFTENAYPFASVFENNNAKAINQKAQDLLYEEFLDNIIALSQQNISENFDLTPIVALTKQINDIEANGRIVIDMTNEESRKSLGISEGDRLLVPEKNNNVYVYGEVSSEGSVMFSPNKDVNFFINKSGGYKKYADTKAIYILHPNGETERYLSSRNIFENQPRSDLKIYPGSVIFIPRKLDNSSSRALAAQAYVSILGNLGLALASLNSINTN